MLLEPERYEYHAMVRDILAEDRPNQVKSSTPPWYWHMTTTSLFYSGVVSALFDGGAPLVRHFLRARVLGRARATKTTERVGGAGTHPPGAEQLFSQLWPRIPDCARETTEVTASAA